MYRGWGFHGAHAGSRRRSPQRAPSLQISRANLSWQKSWRAVCAQTSTPSVLRTLRLANSNLRQRRQWYSIQLTMERQDDFGCSSKCPRVLGLVELGEVSSTVVCMLTTADSHSTREEGYEPQLHHGSRDSALHLPVEPGGVPVPLLLLLVDHCPGVLPRPSQIDCFCRVHYLTTCSITRC